MTDKKVWFITGAGRGMGVDFAKAALAAGNAVVATGRNTDAVSTAVGQADDLLVVKLDVTSATELLTEASATYATPSITDYRERGAAQQRGYEAQNGRQAGDPAKLAQALLTIADQQPPPRRFIAGADAVAIAEQKVRDLQEQVNAYRDLSTSLAWEEA